MIELSPPTIGVIAIFLGSLFIIIRTSGFFRKKQDPDTYIFRKCDLVLKRTGYHSFAKNFKNEFPCLDNINVDDWNDILSVYTFCLCMVEIEKSNLRESRQKEIFNKNFDMFSNQYTSFKQYFEDLELSGARKDIENLEKTGKWIAEKLLNKREEELVEEEMEMGKRIATLIGGISLFLNDSSRHQVTERNYPR